MECEVLPLTGDQGGGSAVLHLSDWSYSDFGQYSKKFPSTCRAFYWNVWWGKKGKKQGRGKIQLFHLKSRTIYAAVPIYQHWSVCRNSPYISRKGMRIKHDPWNCLLLESFLDRVSCRLCYEYLFNHNAQPSGKKKKRSRNQKQRTYETGWRNGKSLKTHGKRERKI